MQMKERTIDILTAVFLIAFSLVMRSQLEGIPREGVLFPLCVLYLIMASSVLLALRAIMAGKGEMSFFGDIPPQRWCLVTAVFIAQVLGAHVCFIQHLHGRRHIYYAHRADPQKNR